MSESTHSRGQHQPFGGGPQGDEERRRREQPPPAPSAQDKAAADKASAELREATQAGSIGAQIILDYNSDAAVGARGGAAGTVEENTMIRDANLVALGLDPLNCSGPPPSPEQLSARREREAGQAREAEATPPPLAKATRMSSLAAGIAPDLPAPPDGGAGGGEATAPTNTEVPAVTQSGTTLSCTMGTWTGEPTSYAYAWTIDGASVGGDTATYEVQAGDVGKSAVCTVTATNAAGSTAAPPSVGHVVT